MRKGAINHIGRASLALGWLWVEIGGSLDPSVENQPLSKKCERQLNFGMTPISKIFAAQEAKVESLASVVLCRW